MNWLIEEENGQSLVEYALILAFVAIVSVASISTFGSGLTLKYEAIVDLLS